MQVTQREALEAADLLRSQGIAVEVTGFLAAQATDPELKRLLQHHQQRHQQQYNTLLNLVQRTTTPVGPGSAYDPYAQQRF